MVCLLLGTPVWLIHQRDFCLDMIWDVHIPITSYRIVPYYIVSWRSIRWVAHHTVMPYIISSNFILSHLIYRFRVVEQVREGECRTHQWSRRGRVLLIKTIAGEGNQLSYQEHYCDTMHYSTCSALLCCRVRASVGRPMSCLLLTVTVTGAELIDDSSFVLLLCPLFSYQRYPWYDTLHCTDLLCSKLHFTVPHFTTLQSIIPSSLLFGNMVSPKAHSLLKLSADFITDRVMPAESTVLAHTYVH